MSVMRHRPLKEKILVFEIGIYQRRMEGVANNNSYDDETSLLVEKEAFSY